DEPGLHGVGGRPKDDGNGGGRLFCSPRRGNASRRIDDVDLELDELGDEFGKLFTLPPSPAVLNRNALSLDSTEFAQALPEWLEAAIGGRDSEIDDPGDGARPRRLGDERRGEEATRKSADERPPVHYSITYPPAAGATAASRRRIIRCPLRHVPTRGGRAPQPRARQGRRGRRRRAASDPGRSRSNLGLAS